MSEDKENDDLSETQQSETLQNNTGIVGEDTNSSKKPDKLKSKPTYSTNGKLF